MADIKISELSQAESLSLSDLMESAIPYNGGFQSRRMTLAQLSNYLENSVLHNALDTTTKNIIGAINEILHDLANYYTTSQTYSKTEVDTLIAGVSGLHFEVVNALPTQDIDMNTIYLVPKQDSGQQDVYDEFICLDDTTTPATWEKIGTTEIDLSDYVTDTELATILNDYVTTSGLNTILQSYATTSAMSTALADKVDKVQGKGLSTEDYTTTEKAKLNGIASGAEVNVQSDWSVSDSSSDAFIQHKPTIPTALSQLTDDSTHRVVTDTEKSTWNDNRAVAEIRLTDEDLNDVTTVGFYFASGGNSVTNKPSGVGNFGLVVIHNAIGSQYVQIISNENGSYRRIKKADGTWTSWAADKFTDEKVKQSPINDYVAHEVLLAKSTDGLEHTEESYKSSGLKFQHGSSFSQFYIGDYDSQDGFYQSHVYCKWIDCYTLNATGIGGLLAIEIGNQQTAGIIRLRNSNGGIVDMFAPTDITEGETVRFPSSSGQLALKSEIPTNVSELTDDIGIVKWTQQNLLGSKNLLPLKTWYKNGYTQNGNVITVNGDGTIYVDRSSATGQFTFYITDYYVNGGCYLPNGTYYLSGCPAGGSQSTSSGYQLGVRYLKNGATASYGNDSGDGLEFTVNGDDYSQDGAWIRTIIVFRNNSSTNNFTFKPMIIPISVKDKTFTAPAKTNINLTIEAQRTLDMIATSEPSNNTSKAYAVGDYMIWQGKFYKVTTAISSGGTINASKLSETTLGAELKSALS